MKTIKNDTNSILGKRVRGIDLKIVKIGGNIINDKSVLNDFLADFAKLPHPKILIHGGGRSASELGKKLGIEPKMLNGRRITSDEDLDIVTMVYAGLINKNIVAQLQAVNCNAIGFSGADANTILADKRPVHPIDFGKVGDVKQVNNNAVSTFLENGFTPVFCAITHDGKGQLLNTNADTIAAEVAAFMSQTYKTELIYIFEKKGVLQNVDDDNSLIQQINKEYYAQLKAKHVIHEGMLPKMDNCFYALSKNVARVIIGSKEVIKDSDYPHTLVTL